MRVAFKEWAAVCRALATGRQDVILRKGGILEPGGQFRLASREFLLFPTFLHQSAEQLVPEARHLLADLDADRPVSGGVVVTHWASVSDAVRVTDLADIARFRGRHVWTDAVVAERFHRWKDELHVLEVVVQPLPAAVTVPWHDDYGGCTSWIMLQDDVPV